MWCVRVCVCWGLCETACAGREGKRANCAASSQRSSADTSSGSRREKGLGRGKKERERWEAARKEGMWLCVCVCVRERQGERERERQGRTAASISPIAGEGPRGGSRLGILLILCHPRKSSSPSRRAGSFSSPSVWKQLCEGPECRVLQPVTADTPRWINERKPYSLWNE